MIVSITTRGKYRANLERPPFAGEDRASCMALIFHNFFFQASRRISAVPLTIARFAPERKKPQTLQGFGKLA